MYVIKKMLKKGKNYENINVRYISIQKIFPGMPKLYILVKRRL